MDVRRLALFCALCLLSIYLYSQLVYQLYGPPPVEPKTAQERGETAPARVEREVARPIEAAPTAGEAQDPLPEGQPVVVETDLFRAEWTTAGARLKKFYLKEYRTAVESNSPDLELVSSKKGQELPVGVEILPSGFTDSRVVYKPNRSSLSLTGDMAGKIVFRGRGATGLEIEKEVHFTGNRYPMDLVVRVLAGVEGGSPAAVVRLTREIDGGDGSAGGWFGGNMGYASGGVLVLNGRRLEQESFDELEDRSFEFGQPQWGGLADKYFVTVGFTGQRPGASVVTERRQGTDPVVVRIQVPMVGSPGEARIMLYFGPKDLDVLEAAEPSLARAVDFGWFWFIALPLLRLIKLVHRVTGNYGVDIIIVSTLIKVLFLPLTKKSMVSMQAMQKLQPEMAKIKERYKDDSQRLQKEMMELYKRHRVNPLSGCLPMLLQLPVFIGLYNTLLGAIELRHAPFFLWVTDLSSPENLRIGGMPVPILVIAMGLSMLVQQWMTPATGDATQRRMMMFMPVIFTFMFINFPSGLVLYWLVNNLLTIAQQYFLVNKPRGKREQRNANRRGGRIHNR